MKAELMQCSPEQVSEALRLENFDRLIHREARKAYGRARSGGLALDYDDIYQEMCVAYCKAVKGFDASKGFAFSTYLVRACHFEINRFLEPLMAERNLHRVRSVEELYGGADDDEATPDPTAALVDHTPNAEEVHSRMQNVNLRISCLSRNAARVLLMLKRPSPELSAAFVSHQDKQRRQRAKNPRIHVSGDMTLGFIGSFLGLSKKQMREIREELAWVAGAND